MPDIMIVDEHDRPVGAVPYQQAYAESLRHRIIRIFLFNPAGELYLQQRSATVANFPLKWDSSVSGKVDAGEEYETAAARELGEELGLAGLPLAPVTKFYSEVRYRDNLLKRFTTLFIATTDREPKPDPTEIADGRWVNPDELGRRLAESPDDYSPGLVEAFREYRNSKP